VGQPSAPIRKAIATGGFQRDDGRCAPIEPSPEAASEPMAHPDLNPIWRKLAAATVRVKIEIGERSKAWEYGTAFMVSRELAVTADHNQPAAVRQGLGNEVEAIFIDPATKQTHDLTFEWLSGCPGDCLLHDVALLRLKERPAGCSLGHLQPALWPAELPSHDVFRVLSGRHVAIYGFPINSQGNGQEERRVVGVLHSGEPLKQETRYDETSGDVVGVTEELRCKADNAHDLAGISGAPIFDVARELVIGVEHSYRGGRDDLVCGSPLGYLQAIWPDFAARTAATWLVKKAKHSSRIGERTDQPQSRLPAGTGPDVPADRGVQSEQRRAMLTERFRALDGKAIETTGRETPILEYLGARLGCDPPVERTDWAGALVEHVSSFNPDTLSQLIGAQEHVARQGSKKNVDLLGEIIALVTPLHMPVGIWSRVSDQLRENQAVVGDAAAGPLSAEAVAARVSGMPMRVDQGADGSVRPFHLFRQPDLQRAPRPSADLEHAPGAPQRRYESLVRDFYEAIGVRGMKLDLDGMLAYLRGYFQRFESIHKRPLYIVMNLPRRKADRQAWMRDLAKFKEAVSHVVMIELCTHVDAVQYEGDLTAIWRCLNSEFLAKA
jgi:hypothetical protein